MISHLLNKRPTFSEWHWTVWKVKDKPMHKMAPTKKVEKINLSGQPTTSLGLVKNQIKTPIKAIAPDKKSGKMYYLVQ